MRSAIYARFSSENQPERSIDAQVRVCKDFASRNGFAPPAIYADNAISGSIMDRPRLTTLIQALREGRFDVLLCHALDRLSRDPEHLAGIFKILKFGKIRLVTVTEGAISLLQIGMTGTMSALFLENLRANTHRGLQGRILLGKSGGGLCYGYDVVQATDGRGNAVRGDRMINREQAVIVIRIFRLFVAGMSPDAIAKMLTTKGFAGLAANTGRAPRYAGMPSAAPASCTTSSTSVNWSGTEGTTC